MDCKDKCANYKPVEVERPADHLGRIFTEDLRIGMVLRRHGMPLDRKLVVILSNPGEGVVKSLQLKAGSQPHECNLWLANSGLQPWRDGPWHSTAWCEEVT